MIFFKYIRKEKNHIVIENLRLQSDRQSFTADSKALIHMNVCAVFWRMKYL